MVMAPDLSLRGGAADVAISGRQLRFRRGFPVIHPGTARLHPKGTFSRFALRAPRQGSASCISALSYNILSKKSKIAINPDFSGPISPFRLLSQKKSVMMEGRICNCIFHGRFCRCPAFFRCITQPRPVKTNAKKQGTRAFARQTVKKTAKPKASEGRKA
jgi:hypothetical protein